MSLSNCLELVDAGSGMNTVLERKRAVAEGCVQGDANAQ